MKSTVLYKLIQVMLLTSLVTLVAVAAAPKPTTGEMQWFNVTATDAGANPIIAGQAGVKYLITSITITSCSDTSDSFYLSSGSSTELWYSAAVPKTIQQSGISGYAGVSLDGYAGGHFLTETGEAFNINLTSGENTNVKGTYLIVK